MTTEHKRRASEGSSTEGRSIPARDFPSPNATFNPKASPTSASFSGSISAAICKWSRPLLTESARQTEFAVTYSKQRTGKFLTEARTHISVFQFSPKSAQNPGWENPKNSPGFATSRTFLPGSAQNIENDVTYSKQRTGEFLPGATTASRACSKSSNIDSKFPEEIAWLLQ
jgi:hypothetical protein